MSIPSTAVLPLATVIVGVDTHKHVHGAVAIDGVGAKLATCTVSANRAGSAVLVDWARGLGTVEAFGIEGTGSYGVGLASFVRRHAVRVVEVSHCDRRKRRNNGKSDTIDAEAAARSVLAGVSTAVPKSADGSAEMARQITVARDTAGKARSAAIITLKTLIVNAPSALREDLDPLTDRKLIDRCHRLKPGEVVDTRASTKHALRAIAARWIALTDEIDAHDVVLDAITLAAAPTLRQAFGIGPDSAAEMMIVAGDNPTRIRSRTRLRETVRGLSDSSVERCDESPPSLSRRASSSQCRALSHRHRPHALASTDHRLRRPQDASGPFQEGHPPLSEAIRGPRGLQRPHQRPSVAHRGRRRSLNRQVTFLTSRGVNAVMESFFSTVKNELADQFASHGDAKMELFDYIEVFYNQRRRHSTIGRISPAAFERRAQVAQVA